MTELLEREEDAGQITAGTELSRWLTGLGRPEREWALVELILIEVAAVLGQPAAGDAERAFQDLGFDSLKAVELRNRLMPSPASGCPLPRSSTIPDLSSRPADHGQPRSGRRTGPPWTGPGGRDPAGTAISVPLNRFRELGVLDAFLQLADSPDESPTDTAQDAIEEIAVMDIDALVDRGMNSSGLDGD